MSWWQPATGQGRQTSAASDFEASAAKLLVVTVGRPLGLVLQAGEALFAEVLVDGGERFEELDDN